MLNSKEVDFILKGDGEVLYPEISKDGLEVYYDVKGKKNSDKHKDKLLDMSGQGKDGELSGFDYNGELSGYDGDNGLVFDGIEGTLKTPKLNGINPSNFTYQLNNNILAFTGDEVKTIKNGDVEVDGRNLFAISELPARSAVEKAWNKLTFINYYANGTGIKVGSMLEAGKEYTISFKVKRLSGDASHSMSGSICFYDPLDDSIFRRFGGREAETISETFVLDSISEDDVIYIYGSSTGVYEFKDIKIEKGSVATEWTPAPEDLIETTDLKGNILGDIEDIVDASPKDRQLGKEVFTEHADDSHVEVEIDGQSYQHLELNDRNMVPTKYEDWAEGYDYNKDDGSLQVANNRMAVPQLIEVEPNKSYYIDTGNPDINYVIRTLDSSKTIETDSWGGSGSSGVKTTNSTTKYLGVALYAPVLGGVVSDLVVRDEFQAGNIKPLIQDASIEDRSFIEYMSRAPTPDNPIEIHSLNDFDVVSGFGKRNILLNSGEEVKNNDYNIGRYTPATPLVEGEEYTVTVCVTPAKGVSDIQLILSGGFELQSIFTFNGTSKQVVTRTFKAKYYEGRSPEDAIAFANLQFYRFPNNGTVTRDTTIHWIKVEKGSKPTPYSPAPEDITPDTDHPLIDKINLSLSEPLRSVGDVKDRIFRDGDGLWKVERNVGYQEIDNKTSMSVIKPTSGIDYIVISLQRKASNLKDDKNTHLNTIINPYFDSDENIYFIFGSELRVRLLSGMTLDDYKTFFDDEMAKGIPFTIQYSLADSVIETLDQELQHQLNTLKSFKGSNYVCTIQNTDNPHKEQLKPTLHATFNSKDYLKETRTLTNLLIWGRELTDEELIHHNELFLNRFNLSSDRVIGGPTGQTLNLLHEGVVGHSLEQNYTINI